MNSKNPKSAFLTLLEIAITISIVLTFILLTVVVIMLVTGSLHAINKNFIQLSFINIISVVVAVIILFMSSSFFFRSFKNIRSSVIKALFHNHFKKNKEF
jgi:hypothetical protein